MISKLISKPINLVVLLVMTLFGCVSTSSTVEANTALGTDIWALQQLNGVVAPKGENGKAAFIKFDTEQNKVSGNTGCNNFFGSYKNEGKTLTFTPLGMTRMYCSKSADLETNFTSMLAKVGSFEVNENQLSLINAEGVVIAILKK